MHRATEIEESSALEDCKCLPIEDGTEAKTCTQACILEWAPLSYYFRQSMLYALPALPVGEAISPQGHGRASLLE